MKRSNILQLLSADELALKLSRLKKLMAQDGIDAMLLTINANLYYMTGRVYGGYIYIHRDSDAPAYFVKRPVGLEGDGVISIHKPENILEELQHHSLPKPKHLALEQDTLSYNAILRLCHAMDVEVGDVANADALLRHARAVKTPGEIQMIASSGSCHEHVYRMIPRLYRDNMTDIELQVEIERVSRLEGCLGQFRINGNDMELYMGNVLAGDNADAPSPYDFAMGGAGADPSLPVGANGTILRPGMTVMVDVNGNYTGYMTDMTRTFVLGDIPEEAQRAHQLSIDICNTLAQMGRVGTAASNMYEKALDMARQAGLEHYFMGHRQHAGFVGHGVGIEINELPVIAPRSRDILEAGNVIAIEPKFVIPGVGAVGIENTYVVREDAPMRCLTNAPTQLINFEQ